jgi:hypothetical protein
MVEPLDVTVDRGAPEEKMRALDLMFEQVGINATIRADYLRLSAETLPYAVMFMGAVTWIDGSLGSSPEELLRRPGPMHGIPIATEAGRDSADSLSKSNGYTVSTESSRSFPTMRCANSLISLGANDRRLLGIRSGNQWLYLKGSAAEAAPAPRRPYGRRLES